MNSHEIIKAVVSEPVAQTPINHRAAVLGFPIAHSRSPVLHNAGYQALEMADWDYSRMECTEEDLPGIIGDADESYVGFSVTMPAKFAALRCADEVTERAQLIGSANTLVRTEAGWRADNTDCDGVIGALGELLGQRLDQINRALVIGGGGTARPALWALAQAGITEVTVLNRSDRRAELAPLVEALGLSVNFINFGHDIRQAAIDAEVIVSTVPSAAVAGHESDLGHAPVLDVIYEPWPTRLTIAAAANGYRTVGGHVMLAHQAFGQFEQFTAQPAPKEQMRQALERSLR
ncbi:shikimate dehydrogenase [Corynebacterium alimapuense]|uniref:shikimate dehydrogenase (NADP(+)) n=1 Tax=Corynebacterium alimapuense TaxID=1576874 RepID=A0A3M8K7P6_9CORY|nr:shikimate dehydrogenase [Corynebacterium alimapuense]RNE49243.1 shikimate dehydrogenase [Corynebacterium alimapuense]